MYQLFVTEVEPADEEVELVMQMALEGIKAQERDPYTTYANRVRELNYGNSYYFKVMCSFYCLLRLYTTSLSLGNRLSHIVYKVLCVVQPITAKDLEKVDPIRSCRYFNSCFKDPSGFTVAIVGKVDIDTALPLVLQYLVNSTPFVGLFSL